MIMFLLDLFEGSRRPDGNTAQGTKEYMKLETSQTMSSLGSKLSLGA
jgi:hypothetical protein